jgi:hypothetical protein
MTAAETTDAALAGDEQAFADAQAVGLAVPDELPPITQPFVDTTPVIEEELPEDAAFMTEKEMEGFRRGIELFAEQTFSTGSEIADNMVASFTSAARNARGVLSTVSHAAIDVANAGAQVVADLEVEQDALETQQAAIELAANNEATVEEVAEVIQIDQIKKKDPHRLFANVAVSWDKGDVLGLAEEVGFRAGAVAEASAKWGLDSGVSDFLGRLIPFREVIDDFSIAGRLGLEGVTTIEEVSSVYNSLPLLTRKRLLPEIVRAIELETDNNYIRVALLDAIVNQEAKTGGDLLFDAEGTYSLMQ